MTSYIVRGAYPDDERGSVYVYVKTRYGSVTTLDAEQANEWSDVHAAGRVQALLNEEDPGADWQVLPVEKGRLCHDGEVRDA